MEEKVARSIEPAPGLIFQWPIGNGMLERTVRSVSSDGVVEYDFRSLKPSGGWSESCRTHGARGEFEGAPVGIETTRPCVVVGERRREPRPNGPGVVHTVLGILDGNRVRIHEGIDPWAQAAERVASWPLVSDPIAEAAMEAERGGICEHADCGAVTEPDKRICNIHAMSHGHALCDGCPPLVHEAYAHYQEQKANDKATAFEEARRDPRERGSGLAARRPSPTAPDVVFTWEAWALP